MHKPIRFGRPLQCSNVSACLRITAFVSMLAVMRPAAISCTALCPNCPTAQQVSQIVIESGFWPNVGLVSLPIVVLIVVAAGLHRLV